MSAKYPIRGFDPTTNEDVIVEAAIARLARDCDRAGMIFDQPSRCHSEVAGDRVILRNSSREVAHYRGQSDADGRFRLVRLVPKS